MKKLSLVILSLILAAPVVAKTTVTPFTEIESNDYDNNSEKEKSDYVGLGLKLSKSLTKKTSLSLKYENFDYDEFSNKDKTSKIGKIRTEMFLNHNLWKAKNGFKLDVSIGTRHESKSGSQESYTDYRFQPKWNYPVSDDWAVSGKWLFYRANDGGTDYYRQELETGVTYTGINNFKLYGAFYDEIKNSITTDNDKEHHLMQFRAKVSTKISDVSVTPWVRLALGEADDKGSDGKDVEGDTTNRYGLDVSKKINNVKYSAQVYYQTQEYDTSSNDKSRIYSTLSASYTF